MPLTFDPEIAAALAPMVESGFTPPDRTRAPDPEIASKRPVVL